MVSGRRAVRGRDGAIARRCSPLAAEAAGTETLTFRGVAVDPFREPERLTVAEAFERFAGIDLLATVSTGGETDREALAAAARQPACGSRRTTPGATCSAASSWSGSSPASATGAPPSSTEYPVAEAALARRTAHDPRVAERFELYACGVELANGFGELTDAAEQRRRFEAEMDEKTRVYGERYPLDEDFLAALAHMPEASGMALGLDRLVMLATGAAADRAGRSGRRCPSGRVRWRRTMSRHEPADARPTWSRRV